MNVETISTILDESVRAHVPLGGQAVAIGGFDGVHTGHRHVLGTMCARAKQRHLRPVVMTFHPHPRAVFGQMRYGEQLTPLDRKIARLQEEGAAHVYVIAFDEAFAQLRPESFVEDILLPLGVRDVTVGYNFSFGCGGNGCADTLRTLMMPIGDVCIVDAVVADGKTVSSTRIRACLHSGQLAEANALLGQPYTVQGTIVHGDKRGRQLGFPTANVQLDAPYVTPAHGVYAVTATIGTFHAPAVLNIGTRPSVASDGATTWEVHVLASVPECYGAQIRVALHAYVRPERTFATVEDLRQAIAHDVDCAIQFFAMNK
ncbi:MAG: riboflavin biosynthesis protein RibF [Paenibacillaceae bacterium]|nr:riboflavin biosynthesis protein RibF [Paenibacillaceae bacterium]